MWAALFFYKQFYFLFNYHCLKSTYLQFFWSFFSCIQTEYGDLLCKSIFRQRFSPNAGKYDPGKLQIRRFNRAPRGPGKSWKVLGFVNLYEQSWKSIEILHNIYSMNFLSQVVYEFFPNCYIRYSTSFFFVHLPVSRIKL